MYKILYVNILSLKVAYLIECKAHYERNNLI